MKVVLAFLAFMALSWGQATQEKASIEGTVVNAISGEALKKVQVAARKNGENEPEPTSTTTDAVGHFLLAGLPPGSYFVIANRNGFISRAYGSKTASRPVTPLKLDRGEKLSGIDIRLQPQGVITGRVLDEDGDPLTNVMVQLVRQTYRSGGQKQFSAGQTSSTNDRGEYRIYGIAPGKYFVSATSSSGRQGLNTGAAYGTVFYPNAQSADAATHLEITPGMEMRGIDLTLVKIRTFRVRGRTVDGAGLVPGNVSVWLMPLHGISMSSRRGSAAKGLGAGEFEFRDVQPGSYALSAENSDGNARLSGRAVVEVSDGNLDGVTLTLRPVASIDGRVVLEGKPGTDLTFLNIYLGPKDLGPGAPGRVQMQADGTFQLQVWPEAYDVNAYGLKDNMYLKSVKFGDADVFAAGLDFSQGVIPGRLEVVVSPAGGQVEGSVVDEKDQPFAHAQVVLVPESARRTKADLFKMATSDLSGHFSLQGIAPGEYKLLAWEEVEPGAWQDPDFLKLYESRGETVVLKEDSRETKQLHVIAASTGSN